MRLVARIPIGTRFATMVVTGHKRIGGKIGYTVLCDCGNRKSIRKSNLLCSKSCGCLTKSIIAKSRTIHGETDSLTFSSWKSMLDRCYMKKHKSWHRYGGRGIRVCKKWKSYLGFREDMGVRQPGTVLDRIDNSKGYSPENCRWVSHKESAINRTSSHFLEFGGIRLTVSDWARKIGLSQWALHARIAKGWTVERALTQPPKAQHNSRCNFIGGANV